MRKFISIIVVMMAAVVAMATTIDVLVAYDQSEQDWLVSADMLPSGMISASGGKLNRIMSNSGIASARDFRVLGEMLVQPSGTDDVDSMLIDVVSDTLVKACIRDDYDGDLVHQYCGKVGVDMVYVLTWITFGAWGAGWAFVSFGSIAKGNLVNISSASTASPVLKRLPRGWACCAS